MLNEAARRSVPSSIEFAQETVHLPTALRGSGWTTAAVKAQVAARRWQRIGRCVVMHNGALSRDERQRAALLNAGPRAVWTSFTAAELRGLTGWSRDYTAVLVPAGARVRRHDQAPTRVHYAGDWRRVRQDRGLQHLAPALVIAAGTFALPRPACGILAAGVQQRLLTARQLRQALDAAPRVRHRAVLILAVCDIGQGSEALSEIDFVRLCRRYNLPEPDRQAVRADRAGRKRYLDAEWKRHRDGRRVVAEVDGALHLDVDRWWRDQYRQNEITLGDSIVLRFPSVIVRTEEQTVADQLRRALF